MFSFPDFLQSCRSTGKDGPQYWVKNVWTPQLGKKIMRVCVRMCVRVRACAFPKFGRANTLTHLFSIHEFSSCSRVRSVKT